MHVMQRCVNATKKRDGHMAATVESSGAKRWRLCFIRRRNSNRANPARATSAVPSFRCPYLRQRVRVVVNMGPGSRHFCN